MMRSIRKKITKSIICGNHIKVLPTYPWILQKNNINKSLLHVPMIELASDQLLQGLLSKQELYYLDPSQIINGIGYNTHGNALPLRLIRAETSRYTKISKNIYWSLIDNSCSIKPYIQDLKYNHLYNLIIVEYNKKKNYYRGYKFSKYYYLPNIDTEDPERDEFHMMEKVELTKDEITFIENYKYNYKKIEF